MPSATTILGLIKGLWLIIRYNFTIPVTLISNRVPMTLGESPSDCCSDIPKRHSLSRGEVVALYLDLIYFSIHTIEKSSLSHRPVIAFTTLTLIRHSSLQGHLLPCGQA
jgi:hypothetical protein